MAGDVTDYGPGWSLLSAEVGLPSGGLLTWTDLFYAREVAVTPNITTLTFEGNDTSQTIDDPSTYDVVVSCDKQDFDAVQTMFGKNKITGLPGVDWAMYMNDDVEAAGISAALRYTLKFKDESVTPNRVTHLRYYWPKGVVKLVRPQSATWKAKHLFLLNATFEKTLVDAAGVALDGVPAGGAPFRVERLTGV
jgi:hypothetical protein